MQQKVYENADDNFECSFGNILKFCQKYLQNLRSREKSFSIAQTRHTSYALQIQY